MTDFPYTIADMEAASKATGLSIISGQYRTWKDAGISCGCPAFILAVHKSGMKPDDVNTDDIHELLGISYRTLTEFLMGFDNVTFTAIDAHPAFLRGREAYRWFILNAKKTP